MIIHAHIICWNEEDLIPYTLAHYSQFCDKIFLYDNMSTDRTLEIAKTFEKVASITSFDTNNQFNDRAHTSIKNTCWKGSPADYVIVCDADEFLYYNGDIIEYLQKAKSDGISLPNVIGYNMYNEVFSSPKLDMNTRFLTKRVYKGVRAENFNKQIIFNPSLIREINYQDGAHHFHPIGKLKCGKENDLKLLHYKYLGRQRVIDRYKLCAQRLSDYNKKNGAGLEYLKGSDFVNNLFDELCKTSIPVI